MNEALENAIANLNKNGIHTLVVDRKEDVVPALEKLIPAGASVSVGGSMSLFKCGAMTWLGSGVVNHLDRYAPGLTPEQVEKIYEQAHTVDVYLTSTNAVTENGELYNVDGRSNRIAAIANGPKRVIFVTGINKIVKDLDAAIHRVKTVAAPQNCVRLNCDTYCRTHGRCVAVARGETGMTAGCSSPGRICCNYLVSAQQRRPGRMTVLFVKEDLGY